MALELDDPEWPETDQEPGAPLRSAPELAVPFPALGTGATAETSAERLVDRAFESIANNSTKNREAHNDALSAMSDPPSLNEAGSVAAWLRYQAVYRPQIYA